MKKILKIIDTLITIIVILVAAGAIYISADGIPKYPKPVKDPGILVSSKTS
ncbi:MAG: hypothetical protein ABIQ74_00145 [Chitinophagales bacterium]